LDVGPLFYSKPRHRRWFVLYPWRSDTYQASRSFCFTQRGPKVNGAKPTSFGQKPLKAIKRRFEIWQDLLNALYSCLECFISNKLALSDILTVDLALSEEIQKCYCEPFI
jgi:hypothetical protein